MSARGVGLCLAWLAVSASAVTPVEKVISLLEDLKTEVETEGKTEATTYDKFACFCKDNTESKSTAITDGQDKIDSLSASIAEDTATKEGKITELSERKKKHEELAKELDETVTRCQKEAAEFEAELADLTKAINSMEKAIKALTGAKPAAFLQSQRDVLKEASDSIELAKALGFSLGSSKSAQAFLQQGVDPNDPAYKFKSSGIIELLEKLNTEFTGKKGETETAFTASKDACAALKKALSDEMQTNGEAMDTLKTDIAALESKIAEDRESLVSAEATLKDDQLYLKDLTERCESAAHGWDQRSASRNDELQALTQALEILTNGKEGGKSIKELDAVNKRAALTQHKAAVKSAVLAPVVKGKAAPSFLQMHRSLRKAEATKALASVHDRVAQLLKERGVKLGSKMLSALATQIASDPFAKVKQLIQSLIERLLKEATEEATKKGFCDTETGKAKTDRDHRHAESKQLMSDISMLQAKKGELEETIDEIKEAVPLLRTSLNETTQLRADEKKENLESIKTAKEGVEAVGEAIAILKVYYSSAARAKVHLQASPVDEDTSGPGFDTAYKGKQSASEGVVGLLETIKSDFARTVKQTEQAEKKAQADFVEFEQTCKSDIAGKEMTQTLSEEDLEKTDAAIGQKTDDLTTAQGLVDSALKTIEDLKPMCIDTGMTFAERVQKREEEIAALKSAICVLDTDGVESDCK
mmetsp:Transcript_30899/g.88905  ORF Transcript_30899/g.88905 Transcript_30899/m.88905 type:complete len:704 (-) Transcript_30899:112-2223(-)